MTLEYTDQLTSTGLSTDEAVVYELLLRSGEQQASVLAKSVPAEHPLSRPQVYKVLEMLISKDLVEKKDPGHSVATFLPKHPVGIAQSFDEQKAAIDTARDQFSAISGQLTSLFNLTSGKPGVQFYEGEEGIQRVLAESLQTTDDYIYTYADTDTIEQYVKEINTAYVEKRLKLGIRKKILMMDSALAREKARNANPELTQIRLMSAKDMPTVPAVIEIYSNKVSYLTFKDGMLTSTIISDSTIYSFHRFLFESHWACALDVSGSSDASNLSST